MTSSRYYSKEIKIGNLLLGGTSPVRVQSMVNTNTLDTEATIAQSIALIEEGCELVRITASTLKEAENLRVIKAQLEQKGYPTPIIADVHFLPKAAEIAATIVEKVRINPGNYIGNEKGKSAWSEEEHRTANAEITKRITPLLTICKAHNTAIRIGSNHGSLSPRLLYRYGDTAEGMVAAAMEFAHICHKQGFHNLVLSMKASTVKMTVLATRLLTKELEEHGYNYPIHLGVTEAGEGIEGRVKSAIGIGTLLADGIGDTIRVSLTEPPVQEIPFAKKIADKFLAVRNINTTCLAAVPTSITPPNSSIGIIGVDTAFEKAQYQQITPCNAAKELTTHIPVIAIASFRPNELRSFLLSEAEKEYKPILFKSYSTSNKEELLIDAAIDFGLLLLENCGQAIWIEAPLIDDDRTTTTIALAILQATEIRFSSAEIVSCPSCGRTKYDIVAAVAEVKQRFSHLKNLKIAVMGCIVNGPGEMAGAHYGYIGEGNHKVSLYRGSEKVARGIDEKEACYQLEKIIRADNQWQEKL